MYTNSDSIPTLQEYLPRAKEPPIPPEVSATGALDRQWLGITGGLVTYPVILLVSGVPEGKFPTYWL